MLKKNIFGEINMKIIVSPYSSKINIKDHNPKDFPFWNEVVQGIKKRGHEVLQTGRSGEEPILNVNSIHFDLQMRDLLELLRCCRTWISVDNFFPHFAHYYKKSGIVIFGPSDPEIFGYPENLNILRNRKFL